MRLSRELPDSSNNDTLSVGALGISKPALLSLVVARLLLLSTTMGLLVFKTAFELGEDILTGQD